MIRLKKSYRGWLILPVLLIGSYIVLKRFRGNPDSLIQTTLIEAGYSPGMAKYWAAVSRFETADYKSNLFKTANNLFGMKFPKDRDTTAQDSTSTGFASYASLKDSANDLVLYLKDFRYPTNFSNLRDMIWFMRKKGYFTDYFSAYYSGVDSKLKSVK